MGGAYILGMQWQNLWPLKAHIKMYECQNIRPSGITLKKYIIKIKNETALTNHSGKTFHTQKK